MHPIISPPTGGGWEGAGSSLLPLPYPYIVPGGRFREIYYWDSYFTMLGLKESGEVGMIENMVKNFAYLIQTYGHIPNGNRTYYLGRSQPPFFTAMVNLLAEIKGDSALSCHFKTFPLSSRPVGRDLPKCFGDGNEP
jgi:neutral trehalase